MIRKAKDTVKDVREGMRGGKGKVEIHHIFNSDELNGRARLCARIKLNPGSSIGLHEHENEAEIFYIVKGKGLFDDNGTKVELTVGDSILTGDGAAHSVENIGDEDLEMLAVILT